MGISENAQLARAVDEDEVFLLTNGEKWSTTSDVHFNNYGFAWEKVTIWQPAELDLFKKGMSI